MGREVPGDLHEFRVVIAAICGGSASRTPRRPQGEPKTSLADPSSLAGPGRRIGALPKKNCKIAENPRFCGSFAPFPASYWCSNRVLSRIVLGSIVLQAHGDSPDRPARHAFRWMIRRGIGCQTTVSRPNLHFRFGTPSPACFAATSGIEAGAVCGRVTEGFVSKRSGIDKTV